MVCTWYLILWYQMILLLRSLRSLPAMMFFGLVWFKYRAPVPKLPRHLPLDGGSGPRLHHATDGASMLYWTYMHRQADFVHVLYTACLVLVLSPDRTQIGP